MSGRLILGIANPALDANGNVDAGATLTFYQNLTTNPATVYGNQDFTNPLSTPLTCDAAGRFPQVWAPDRTYYSVKWTPSGASSITYDYIQNSNGGIAAATGDWVPTLTATSGAATLGTVRGKYRSFNDVMVITWQITVTNVGTLSGPLIMGALPAVVENDPVAEAVGGMTWSGMTTSLYQMKAVAIENTQTAALKCTAAAATTEQTLTASDLANGAILRGSMTYITNN